MLSPGCFNVFAFCLSILDEVVHHELIPQIWWNDFIPHTSIIIDL